MTQLRDMILTDWLDEIAKKLEDSSQLTIDYNDQLQFDEETAVVLLSIIDAQDEKSIDTDNTYYAACIFAFDIAIAQFQFLAERGQRAGIKTLDVIMSEMARLMLLKHHSVGFWMPLLNAYYDVHVTLSEPLKDAYLTLVESDDTFVEPLSEDAHIDSIRNLLDDMKEMSDFEVTEHFFAQSHAMPDDFFIDLLLDLYSLERGKDIAILLLLTPRTAARAFIVDAFAELMNRITLSSRSLARLKLIKTWFPKEQQPMFDEWIKTQRKKGVVFPVPESAEILDIYATEVDGSGAQGIFILLKKNRKQYFCGMLLHKDFGIKDIWLTPPMSAKEAKIYFADAFQDVVLRQVSIDYLDEWVGYFLAITLARGIMPSMLFLELEETLGLQWLPEVVDIHEKIESLAVLIQPFNLEVMRQSFAKSRRWDEKYYVDSWFWESPEIDKIVNQNCLIQEGVKSCNASTAEEAVLTQIFEKNREALCLHFVWTASWLKASAKKNEKLWEDALFVAYAIHNHTALRDIPIVRLMIERSVANSIETMDERKSYLAEVR